MNLKGLIAVFDKLKDNQNNIEKSLIRIYLEQNELDYNSSEFLIQYFNGFSEDIYYKVKANVERYEVILDFNILIEILELVIPKEEKKENGMVYTPFQIKDFIIRQLINVEWEYDEFRICDPSCGCGSFLITVAKYIHQYFGLSYLEIYKNILFGVDIVPHNVEKAKILLIISALSDGETITEDIFNIKVGNSLDFDWKSKFRKVFEQGGFTHVVGNPPYVRAKNLNDDVKKTLQKWETAKVGNPDLYIPFYELGIQILRNKGNLGYISINTFLKSVNGRELRKFLVNNTYDTTIIDFKDYQVFKNVSSYTCIVLLRKISNEYLKYSICKDMDGLFDCKYNTVDFKRLPCKEAWNLVGSKEKDKIDKIESIGKTLGERYNIKNGLATLRNDLFIFRPIKEDNCYYFLSYEGKEYAIEKSICRNIIKPNIIKNEGDLIKFEEKIIFPYSLKNMKATIIEEDYLKEKYPYTYSYLINIRDELSNRDKGKGKYPAWYAFGRSQGLNNFGGKIFIPYIAERPVAVISNNDDTLFYCGYAIFIENTKDKIILKRILESEVFWYYIKNTSKPYVNGYMSLAKNYIKNFGIPELTEEQKQFIIQESSLQKLNQFIDKLYGI